MKETFNYTLNNIAQSLYRGSEPTIAMITVYYIF